VTIVLLNSNRLELENKYENLIGVNQLLNRQLVSFQANKRLPIYNWFSFKEGFSSGLVKIFIKESNIKAGKILDPFAGACTTLLSAKESGFDSVGIEIMPIGEFILNSKLLLEQYDVNTLANNINDLKKINFEKYPIDSERSFKHVRITEKAFPNLTERKLNGFLNYLSGLENAKLKQILNFACFSILEKISYTRKDGQYLRWDYRAEKGKTKFDKGKIFEFEEALLSQLSNILNDLRTMSIFSTKSKNNPKIKLCSGSCLEILPKMDAGSFGLVITSPPYCNRYDYTRTYALELVYLGLGEADIRNLRQSLLSATVENKDKIEYLKKVYKDTSRDSCFMKAEITFNKNKALQEVLKILETHKEQKKLNNPGIVRMVKNYFYEHAFVIMELARILKKGGKIYYVNDNVRYAGEVVPVDLILSEFAQEFGLRVNKIYALKTGKGNSSQQMSEHGRQEVRKCVYVWEK